MLQEPTTSAESGTDSTAHLVHALMQFLLAIRYRKNVVIVAVVAAGLAGALYYATATPLYRSTAAILVMGSTSPDGTPPSVGADDGGQRNLMGTLQDLFTRPKVLEKVVEHLRGKDLVDLAGVPENVLPAVIRGSLSAAAVRGTRTIEVSYRATDPHDAKLVVEAVLASYTDFLNDTNNRSTREFKDILTKERNELEMKIFEKRQELRMTQAAMDDIGVHSGSAVVHPVVERAVSFNKSLVEVQKKRAELEASLNAIQTAIRNGEDLQQHILTVANVVGKEILMRSLGFDYHDVYTQSLFERQLLEERSLLETMQEHLGPAHPDVVAKIKRIRMTEQYLIDYRQRIKNRVSELQRTDVARLLVNMVQQKLAEAWQLEASLQAKFDQANAAAIKLNGELINLEAIEHDLQYLRNLRAVLLEKISKTELREEGPELRTAVVQEATEASNPFSPNLRRVMMMALVGGLAAGLALVYVLDTLDDRFRSVDEMQAHLAAPVLAMIRQLPTFETQGIEALQVHVAPNAAESEAFRTLRTALALADNEARQIVITSAEPGDGKTTVLANLAVCYAQSNKKTLLIDADLRRPGLTAIMDMRGVGGLSSVIRGEADVAAMAAEHVQPTGLDALDVLPSGPRPANPAELLASPRFSELLAWAETVYDQILIDSPPALATSDTAVIGRLVDGAVVVVQPDKNRRRKVVRAAESLVNLKIPLLGVIVNRIGGGGDRGYYGYSSGYGYGYGYEPGYSADEAEPDEPAYEDERAGEDLVEQPAALPSDTPQGIVPRRVA